jgi:peptidoglycan hydrolase-like protein with peptidoglycan-binding domain
MLVALIMTSPVFAAQARPAAAAPEGATTAGKSPPMQSPAETAGAMGAAERLALQSDLAWVGQYNGAITGDVSERMIKAIQEFQKAQGDRPTGVLNPRERSVLAETAHRRRANVGWRMVTDPATGARLGLPTKLVPKQTSDANGARWSSPNGTVEVLLTRWKEANPTTAKLAEKEKRDPPGRSVDYTVVKPDFFVLSGLQGLKKFYLRGTFKGDEVRVLTILYDQATENTVEPVVIAMSSAFNPFPNGGAGVPARKLVEYGTGIVVSDDGAIVADREVTGDCLAITIPGLGHADRVAEDKDHDLALLRIYGARGLRPLDLAGGAAKSSVDVTGIADPQSQGGGDAVTSLKVSVTQAHGDGDPALSPPPGLGFSGAAALDGGGKFAGIVLLKPVIVAASSDAAASAEAELVQPDTLRDFLKANGVAVNGTSSDARAAVVRVICVRK